MPNQTSSSGLNGSASVYGESTVQTSGDVIALIEERARVHGIDSKELVKISFCESTHRPYARNENKTAGNVVWSSDVGPMQINDHYHSARATRMGLDINNPHDNIVYGVSLASQQGTKPWQWSKKCWSD